jgi:6-phosphogluconolactonase (cycloisomerase 2 family)
MSWKFAGLMLATALAAIPAQAQPLQAYVGSYTPDPLTFKDNHGEGIYLISVDPATGLPGAPKLVAKGESTAWIALSADRKFLYAANEYEGFGPKKSGSITAYAIDASGALKKLNTVSSEGGAPCHVSIHASGKFLLIANYMGGTFAVVRIRADGSLGEATDVTKALPRSNPRQAADSQRGQLAFSDHDGSRAHMIASDPTGRYVIGDDAGRDTIHVWTLDANTGKLTEVTKTAAVPGSAPRHFAFSSDGKRLYQLFEQNSRLGLYDFNNGKPVLRGKTLPMLPENYFGSATASEILMAKDGRHIYAANRTQDSIAVFAVGADGNIRRTAIVPTAGNHPRSLTIDPSGKFLYSLNQRGDHIATFRLDPATGIPRFTGHYAPVASPAIMVFR